MITRFFDLLCWLHGDKGYCEVIKEWHSFWIGWGEGLTFFIPARVPISTQSLEEIEGEWHYYNIGRGIGFASFWVILMSLLRWLL
jgi:hypothetical protein